MKQQQHPQPQPNSANDDRAKNSSTQKKAPQKPKGPKSAPMIALTNTNKELPTSAILGGVYIDANRLSRGDEDGGTVISEITNADLTEVTAADALDEILGKLTQSPTGTGTGIGTPTNNSSSKKKDPPGAAAASAPASTPSTAQSTPDRSVTEKPATATTTATTNTAAQSTKTNRSSATPPLSTTTNNKPVKNTVNNNSSSNNNNNNNNSSTGTKSPPTIAAAITTVIGATKIPNAISKKKAPPPEEMNVSPNPRARKSKTPGSGSDSGRTSPNDAIATTAVVKPTPTAASSNNNNNNNVGLSELSKQLRLQRAKNEWQHNEIARLERQLRILSDLKGVSVADLRFSLQSACQQEAHGELRNQVQSLQAQLEALQMQRDATRRRASTAVTEAAESKIATLQLRIGELEEVDHAKQAELEVLYAQLREQTARATTLEASAAQQATRLEQFETIAKQYMQDMEQSRMERDALRQQVAELNQQLQDQQTQARFELEMKNIEAQLELEKQRKQEYLNQARQQRSAPGSVPHQHHAVNNRLSGAQLAAIHGVVRQQAGLPPMAATADASTIAITVAPDDDDIISVMTGPQLSVTRQNPFEADTQAKNPFDEYSDDDISRLADEMDSSVHTLDALMMQGLSEAQAAEAMEKDAKIMSLYEQLREQATKTAQLQTLCANQKMQLDRFCQELNEKEAILKSTQNTYDFAKTEHDSLYQRFCDVELQLSLEQEKVEGLERQLYARVHESNLRNDQFSCRFQVQNERIADLEQQQSSLYEAFKLLEQEVKAQDNEQKKLQLSLDEADSAVARQLREQEQKKVRRSSRQLSPDRSSQRNLFSHGDTSRDFPSSPTVNATPISPYATTGESTGELYTPQEFTSQLQGVDQPMQMYGYLWKLDKIKGWKKRFFALYGEEGMYQLTYSDGPRERVKGTIHGIITGVSTVSETNKSIKKPFSFVLHVDPLLHSAPVLYAAALTADDFKKWMSALKAATIRPEDGFYMSQADLSSEAQFEADMELARRLHSASMRNLDHDDADAQVEADHLIAMRLSVQNPPSRAYA